MSTVILYATYSIPFNQNQSERLGLMEIILIDKVGYTGFDAGIGVSIK